MNFEKLLAENMIRFGAKNLSKDQIYKLTEQINASPDVTTHVLYKLVTTKLGDQSKLYWEGKPQKGGVAMTDIDRLAVLNHVQEWLSRYIKIKSTTPERAAKQITAVAITPAGTTVTNNPAPPVPTTIPQSYSGTYPAVDQPNPELQNFYLIDNEINVSTQNKAKFDALVKTLLANIPKNEKIVEVKISAGSSTSKVPTTYKGGDYKGNITIGQKNNEFLAADRCVKIEEALTAVVKTNIPDVTNIKIEQRQIAANRGTEYTEKERSYYFSSGVLDPTKKNAYDKAYGPYKGSYGSVTIITESVQIIPPEVGPSVKISSNWQTRIDSKHKNVTPPRRGKSSPGGGQTFVGVTFNTTKCKLW
jgi:hypothetical protein